MLWKIDFCEKFNCLRLFPTISNLTVGQNLGRKILPNRGDLLEEGFDAQPDAEWEFASFARFEAGDVALRVVA
jgi:hypothetical protein